MWGERNNPLCAPELPASAREVQGLRRWPQATGGLHVGTGSGGGRSLSNGVAKGSLPFVSTCSSRGLEGPQTQCEVGEQEGTPQSQGQMEEGLQSASCKLKALQQNPLHSVRRLESLTCPSAVKMGASLLGVGGYCPESRAEHR